MSIIVSSASTGKLTTQIRFGAPFDIFLSADTKTAQLLINDGLAMADSFQLYAEGKLALIAKKDYGDSAQQALQSELQGMQLALANPKTAPYGKQAKKWLTQAGFTDKSFQYLTGENIVQTWQFFEKGGAEAAIVSLSQIKLSKDNLFPFWILPKVRVQQAAVILNKAKADEEQFKIAQLFMQFLSTPKAIKIIEVSGYDVNI